MTVVPDWCWISFFHWIEFPVDSEYANIPQVLFPDASDFF